jgi:hypothetical protein
LKGQATGRETHRGPKTAREQAVSREKPLFCQMKRPRLWRQKAVIPECARQAQMNQRQMILVV